jgi:hypothetical protein
MSWSWSYGSWIYNYLCNLCLSPLTLWVWIMLRQDVLDTTLCDKVCQWLATGQWFSPDTVSSTNKTDSQDITEIFLKVAFNTIALTLRSFEFGWLGFFGGVCNYTCIKVHVKFDLAGDTNLILFLNCAS